MKKELKPFMCFESCSRFAKGTEIIHNGHIVIYFKI